MSKLEFKPQDRQSIDFAEEERQKTKNLFDYKKYLNLATNYDYKSNSYYCKKIQLEPLTTYTVSFPTKNQTSVILLINRTEQVNGAGFVDTREEQQEVVYKTDESGCLYIGTATSDNSSVNSLLSSLNLQIEEGNVATQNCDFEGKIIHENDINWKILEGEADTPIIIPMSWDKVKELCFRILGNDQATFGYKQVPKEFWHNDGTYGVLVEAINEHGSCKGGLIFSISNKTSSSFQLNAVVKNSAMTGFKVGYR